MFYKRGAGFALQMFYLILSFSFSCILGMWV